MIDTSQSSHPRVVSTKLVSKLLHFDVVGCNILTYLIFIGNEVIIYTLQPSFSRVSHTFELFHIVQNVS